MKALKIIEGVLFALVMLLGVWMLAGIIEVACRNCAPNPEYFDWNFFEVMFRLFA